MFLYKMWLNFVFFWPFFGHLILDKSVENQASRGDLFTKKRSC